MTFVRFGILIAGTANATNCGNAVSSAAALGGLCAAGDKCKDDTTTCTDGQYCAYGTTGCVDASTLDAAAAGTDGEGGMKANQKCGAGETMMFCENADSVCLIQETAAERVKDNGVALAKATFEPASETDTQCIAKTSVQCGHATHVVADSATAASITTFTYKARASCSKLKPRGVDGVPCAEYKFKDFELAKPGSGTGSSATEAKLKHTGSACITDCCKITGTETEIATQCGLETAWCAYDATAKKCENKAIANSTTLAEKGCLPEATSAANVKASSLGAAVVFVTTILLA